MESVLAYFLGGFFLIGSAAITIYMLACTAWNIIKGEGLSGPVLSIADVAGVGIEGVNMVPAGEPNAPANANRRQKRLAKKIAA
ncbi:MAG: hypothetical protein KDJ62_11360 [Rhodobiaceae bacterium]|nr:hypothetical protein [Rhodobiaceae bacterium]MCC0048380.1 hypothetical protein [Rhodobiaceae bacterium]